jgi:hypothetical protein
MCGVWGVGCGVRGVGCGVEGLGFQGSHIRRGSRSRSRFLLLSLSLTAVCGLSHQAG